MIAILQQKVLKLVHGDDGVALVVTLALFMLLYVSCAGVFAVGQSVKERIILQNAVDAAAYSAAVVQADTLSRIATINRVMASTYNRMVLRQMDLINDMWLTMAGKGYEDIQAVSSYIGSEATGAPLLIRLYNDGFSISPTAADVARECASFNEISAAEEVAECRRTIAQMNRVIYAMLYGGDVEAYRYKNLYEEMKRAAELVLEANVPEHIARKCGYKVYLPAVGNWMAKMSDLTDEETFVKLAENGEEAWGKFQSWFDQEGDEFIRSYTDDRKEGRDLRASWHWYNKLGQYQGQVTIAASDLPEEFRELFFNTGDAAEPFVPSPAYFTGLGAVTVAVVRENENTWAGFVKPSGGSYGLYDAFKPADASDYTLVLASAQAGYRDRAIGEKKTDDFTAPNDGKEWRSYVLSGGDVSVYGKSDDWDALFIPVVHALGSGRLSAGIVNGGGWNPLGDENILGFVNLAVSRPAMPNMHNDQSTVGTLGWGSLLNLMYH